jgi:DNA-directed RNA polymerase subunit RPC12/RpoP
MNSDNEMLSVRCARCRRDFQKSKRELNQQRGMIKCTLCLTTFRFNGRDFVTKSEAQAAVKKDSDA